jgi:DNA-binding NtrC family response regulator
MTTRWHAELHDASTFEEGADELAEQVLEFLDDALAETSIRLLRASVHLRPDGGYVGLRWVTHDAQTDRPNLSPSSTAWLLVREQDAPVVVNLTRKQFATADGARSGDLTLFRRRNAGQSMQLMRDRLVTHLLALPLRAADGAVVGMISVETNAMHALRDLDLFAELPTTLDRGLRTAGAALSVLPNAPLPPPTADALLPVAGPSMARTLATLARFARLDNTLLLVGETGVGKTEIIDWIVARSPRADSPLIRMHVAGQSAEKLESELFGWTRGSFTGALTDRVGLVACAEGGTLVLDEVDKLSLDAQACLLELLGSRTYRRRGDNRDQSADVRFILTSNANLPDLVDAGTFRPELYFRVAALEVRVPALSERRDEVGAWAAWLARRTFGTDGRGLRVTPAARRRLAEADWPGNLRQLHSVMLRAGAMAELDWEDGPLVIDEAHLPPLAASESPALSGSLDAALIAVAARVVDHLEQDGPLPDHRLLDALLGYVVDVAVARHGRADGAKLLGRAAMLRGGNHHTWIDKQSAKAAALRAALGDLLLP